MKDLTQAKDLDSRRRIDRDRIENGEIEIYLRWCPHKLGAVELAMALGLDTQLVRNYLSELVDLKKVRVSNKRYQNKLNSEGLVYRWWK